MLILGETGIERKVTSEGVEGKTETDRPTDMGGGRSPRHTQQTQDLWLLVTLGTSHQSLRPSADHPTNALFWAAGLHYVASAFSSPHRELNKTDSVN